VQRDLAALHRQGPILVIDPARSAAVGARLLGSQGLRLLLQEGAQRTLGQASSGGRGELLKGLEVDGLIGTRLAKSTPGDDLSPLGGQALDVLEFLR
jgi:hypothetical protein